MKYLIVDIETTGFGSYEGVTEITAIEYNSNLTEHNVVYDGLTDPGKSIPAKITQLTGITNSMVEGKPKFKPVFETLINHAIANDLTIIAHNAPFEISFFIENVGREKTMQAKWGCTRAAQMKLLNVNQFAKHMTRLQDCARHFDLEYNLSDAHRARYDVELTAKVLAFQLEAIGVESFYEASNNFIKR